ncbi:MAG: CPBP family intramembrane glutamic endopeptidase [Cyanobacteria bacterium P01_D01_bin.116]
MVSNSINRERQKVVLIILFTYILPVLLVYLQLIPFTWRFYLLILAAAAILIINLLYRFSPLELGFTKKNLLSSLKAIALPTLGCALLMFGYYLLQGSRIDNSDYSWTFYLFFVAISSPLQEFLYRGFLFNLFSTVKMRKWQQILLSAFLYSFVHLIYRDLPTLISTFAIGIFWGYHYIKYRNLHSIIISHSLLGAIAILVGLI